MLAPVGPRMQAAGSQCLKLQIAVAFPDPQTRAFPGRLVSRKDPASQNFRRPRRDCQQHHRAVPGLAARPNMQLGQAGEPGREKGE